MVELLRYLEAHGFTCYIVSGGGRDFMRPITGAIYGIPPERVVGSAQGLKFDGADGHGDLLIQPALDIWDDGPEKPVRIWSRIGRRPILSAGNSNGDDEMLMYSGRPGAAALRLLVLHDDAEREFDYTAGAERALEHAEKYGWTVVSMRNDWATVFSDMTHSPKRTFGRESASGGRQNVDLGELRPDGELVWIPAQTAVLGSDVHYDEEAPARDITVDGFWIQTHQVTNAEFAEFVSATGYVTVAERPLDPADYPDAPAENLQPGSMVFTRTQGPVDLRHLSQWWTWTPGASWRHPVGPHSSIDKRADHPVVHVAFEDAEAYAAWAGLSLPTEAEWETAARGGLDGATYTWGDEPEQPGARLANYWHGDFPWRPDRGYGRTTAVGSFPPNGYGLVDMAGNVWEWTTDWYADTRAGDPCCEAGSYDPRQQQFRVPRKVIKGGSFLCADNYCLRYRPAARRPQPVDTGMSHIGFRCVKR